MLTIKNMNSPSFRLAECEALITQGIKSHYEAGKALIEIRDNKLFIESGYESFEDYCLLKWKFDKTYASRLISSYTFNTVIEAHNEKLPIGNKLPLTISESHVRPLMKIEDPEMQMEAYKKVVDQSEENHEPITAKQIKLVVSEYCAPCVLTNCDYRLVTYLTPSYYKKFDTQKRGEKEADFLRRIVEAYLDHPELLLPYMKQLTA